MEWKLVASVLAAVIIASTAHEHHKHHRGEHKSTAVHGYHHEKTHKGHGSSESDAISDQFIQNKVKTIVTQQDPTELIQFLSALNTTDGQIAVKHLGVDPTIVPKLIQLLKGSPQDIAKAKAQIQTLMQSFNVKNGKVSTQVREVFKVYQTYLVRVEAQKQMQGANLDALKKATKALADSESSRSFGGISFKDLLQTLNTKGEQGRKEVIDKLVKWITVATSHDLQRASKVVYKAFAKKDDSTTVPPTGNFTTSRPAGNMTTSRPAGNFTTSRPAGNFTTTHPTMNVTTTHSPMNLTTTHSPMNLTTTHPPMNITTTHPPMNLTTSHPSGNATTEHTTTAARLEPMKKASKKAE